MMRCYEFLPNLPALPPHLRQAVVENKEEFINYSTFKDGVGRSVIRDGQPVPSTSFRIRRGPADVIDWISQHITNRFVHIGTTESDPTKTICGPHIDLSRNYTIIYPINTGGENVATVFWRLKKTDDPMKKQYYLDYDELEEIDRVIIPQETWCVVHSKIIHSVENLEGARLTLQIGLWDYIGMPDICQ